MPPPSTQTRADRETLQRATGRFRAAKVTTEPAAPPSITVVCTTVRFHGSSEVNITDLPLKWIFYGYKARRHLDPIAIQ
jgi:hypothetical protein